VPAATVNCLMRDWHLNAPASAADIHRFLEILGNPRLPADYLVFLRRANGAATVRATTWSAELEAIEHIPDLNRTYGIPEGLLFFGHVNAGWALVFDLRGKRTRIVLFDLFHLKACQDLGGNLGEALRHLEAAAPRHRRPPRRLPDKPVRTDIGYVPTPAHVVRRLLRLARVQPGELVYDLGCGDGRIVIAAARQCGARAIGFDIQPERVEAARANVRKAYVGHLVEIRQGNLFEVDLREADVVTVYLLPSINDRLLPRFKKLKPGARLVSHAFGLKRVAENQLVEMRDRDGNRRYLYRWDAPLRPASAS
jgi:precorrin-6B methylase 2